jgi:hypothetical protein
MFFPLVFLFCDHAKEVISNGTSAEPTKMQFGAQTRVSLLISFQIICRYVDPQLVLKWFEKDQGYRYVRSFGLILMV